MRFAPKDDETIAKEQNFGEPFPRGEYDVKIVEAADETSKKGNEQIHLKVQIFNDEGHRRTAHDYLVEAMSKKLKSFCMSAGLQDEYESGELAAIHCAGQELRAKIDVEPAKDGYEAKNVIREYIPRGAPRQPAQRTQAPASAPANGNGQSAMKAAWLNFLARWNAINPTETDEATRNKGWLKSLNDFFPNCDPRSLGAAEWMRFGAAVRLWDPTKGFPNSKAPAPPFAEEPVFDEASIPF